ncbi:MAG: hypothetical protein OXF55_08955 [Caldilineaceae bacterium]|nr:hypothetical protein [Caldilineaceae bacterium]MDE0070950.1 hypothetical protein [Caldilineaceae bacterium]MDE0181432.1 hypothetical protein [Caldilineaceae bacterium]MDE0430102.1 hypothetical protein [Caldilineaceae bacterium]
MPYSIQSTLQELLSNEQAKAVIEKHMPGASTHPDLPMAMHMTLQQISYYPEAVQAGLSQDKLQAIDAELKQLG